MIFRKDNFPTYSEWLRQGQYIKVLGHHLFFQDSKEGSETVCFLHGFPTSSYDFWKTIPEISKDYRTVIHDHLGFGCSDKPIDHKYSLFDQADRAIALWQELALNQIHLVAHDYGTSVATELVARQNNGQLPLEIKSLTLCNGSILIDMANLRWIQILLKHRTLGPVLAKFSNHTFYNLQMKRLWFNQSKYDVNEMRENWKIMNFNNGKSVISKVSYYLNERKQFRERWLDALKRFNAPMHILWAQNDPVSVKAIAEKLHQEIPQAIYIKMNESGHYPMLESPKEWINHLLSFLQSLDD